MHLGSPPFPSMACQNQLFPISRHRPGVSSPEAPCPLPWAHWRGVFLGLAPVRLSGVRSQAMVVSVKCPVKGDNVLQLPGETKVEKSHPTVRGQAGSGGRSAVPPPKEAGGGPGNRRALEGAFQQAGGSGAPWETGRGVGGTVVGLGRGRGGGGRKWGLGGSSGAMGHHHLGVP